GQASSLPHTLPVPNGTWSFTVRRLGNRSCRSSEPNWSNFLHQPNDTLAAHALLLLEQILVNAEAAVPLLARIKRRLDEHLVALACRPRRLRSLAPGVESARRHRPLTQLSDRVVLLRLGPREFHRWSFAKKAVAFFRTSRSMRSSRTSFRKRPSSSRSLLVRMPGLPLPRSARACSTQFRSDDSVRSRSRGAAPTGVPSATTT